MKPASLLLAFTLATAAVAPLLPKARLTANEGTAEFAGWPASFEGRSLSPLPPAAQDVYFTRDFPGKVARFASGSRQVVVRWVNSPTRRLHPASHCFAGAGYAIHPLPMNVAADGSLMSCISARKAGEALRVCEQLQGAAGQSWPDISSWYWHAVAAPAGSSWWSYVVVEHE